MSYLQTLSSSISSGASDVEQLKMSGLNVLTRSQGSQWNCTSSKMQQALFSEGPWLFVGMPNVVKVWNTESGAEYSLNGPVGQVNALESINDLLFAGVEVWDHENWQCIMTLNGHDDVVKSLRCWDKYLFFGSLDCTIKVWASTEDGSLEVIYTHSEEHGILALSGMTDLDVKPILYCSCSDKSVHLYELPTFTDRGRLFAKQEVQTLQIGPGGLFFTGDQTGLLTVYSVYMASRLMAETWPRLRVQILIREEQGDVLDSL
uniref:Uncharacterized protein n=1 Tax=Quercus lobata TaxID=97700 RepID=A0A7N2REC5_QUELO